MTRLTTAPLAAAALLLGIGPTALAAAGPDDLAGSWTWTWKDGEGKTHKHVLDVESAGGKLTAPSDSTTRSRSRSTT